MLAFVYPTFLKIVALVPACRFRLCSHFVVLGMLLCLPANAIAQQPPRQPNIVIFYIDDLGWTDLGFMYQHLQHDSQYYETPNIDRLAQQSVMFTNAYACGPNCAPSRASLMTGGYTPRHGIYTVGDPRRGNARHRRLEPIENNTVLADSFVTIAESLQQAGYKTATMGKWHLGKDPTTQGFDMNVAGREWGSPSGGGYHSPFRFPNLSVQQPGTYLTDALTDRAVEFIETQRDKPFFLYLTHYAVHTPIQAKPAMAKRFEEKAGSQFHHNHRYAAMLESVDQSVGRVLQTLDRLNLADNTLVVFSSDNGGHGVVTSNRPLRGSKGMLYEGGIRVPLLMRLPGTTRAGTKCDENVIAVDLYPTILELSHAQPPVETNLDGVSLLPLLKEPDSRLPERALYWHFPAYLQRYSAKSKSPFRTTPAGAIRVGQWKLIEWFETGDVELYNLQADIAEAEDLSEREPDRAAQMLARLRKWRQDIGAPVPTTPNPRYRAP